MDDQIVSFIDGLKSNKQIASLDEASIKQTIVMRLLFLLGWDIFNIDEVNSNYKVKNQPIDYSLRFKNNNKIFINVKKMGKALDKSQQLLLEYASKEGVDFTVFTNGLLWWFYLTLDKRNLEKKNFCSLDFLNQKADDIVGQLKNFLAKNPVSKGKALELAENILKKRHQKLIEETIPAAWAKMLSEPPKALVDLLIETTEEICGYAAERDAVVKFLTEGLNQLQYSNSSTTQKPPAPEPPKAPVPTHNEQSLSSFTFKKKVYPVKSWSDMLMKLCEILQSEYKKDIGSLVWYSIGDKYYFSKDMNELRCPEQIEDTEIFIQTYMTPNEAVKVAYSILSFFGYSQDDFSVSSENK